LNFALSILRLYRQHHPYPRFGAANVVTLVRALLTGFLLWIAVMPPSTALAWTAGWTAGLIAALDGIDGLLARRAGMVSAFGARFDMETDAALLVVLSILAWRYDKAGAWVLLIGLMRYLFVAAGYLLPWMSAPLTPTRRGRVVAVVQMVTLAVILVVPRPLAITAAATALALLVWSFAVDVGRLWRARPARGALP
jgi:phosphatidylglycerophosphate synthase